MLMCFFLLYTTFYNVLFQSYEVCNREHNQVKNYHFKKIACAVYQAHVFHSMNSTLYMYLHMYHYFKVNVTSLPANCWLKESLRLGQSTSRSIEPDTVKCTRTVLWSIWSQSIMNKYALGWRLCENMPAASSYCISGRMLSRSPNLY